ncbi:MAG TPA: hypothetical protein VLL76_04440 [Candidatus Omnitrophota bacterium]|nr:hypothetical protein [Candidatus Omnitrophota bacterium]
MEEFMVGLKFSPFDAAHPGQVDFSLRLSSMLFRQRVAWTNQNLLIAIDIPLGALPMGERWPYALRECIALYPVAESGNIEANWIIGSCLCLVVDKAFPALSGGEVVVVDVDANNSVSVTKLHRDRTRNGRVVTSEETVSLGDLLSGG